EARELSEHADGRQLHRPAEALLRAGSAGAEVLRLGARLRLQIRPRRALSLRTVVPRRSSGALAGTRHQVSRVARDVARIAFEGVRTGSRFCAISLRIRALRGDLRARWPSTGARRAANYATVTIGDAAETTPRGWGS